MFFSHVFFFLINFPGYLPPIDEGDTDDLFSTWWDPAVGSDNATDQGKDVVDDEDDDVSPPDSEEDLKKGEMDSAA